MKRVLIIIIITMFSFNGITQTIFESKYYSVYKYNDNTKQQEFIKNVDEDFCVIKLFEKYIKFNIGKYSFSKTILSDSYDKNEKEYHAELNDYASISIYFNDNLIQYIAYNDDIRCIIYFKINNFY